MWRYLVALGVFDLCEAAVLASSPDPLLLRYLPGFAGVGHNLAALAFLLAGLLCLAEVAYRFQQRGETPGVLRFRFVVQGCSLALSAAWCVATLFVWLIGAAPLGGAAGWVFVTIGQGLMLRPSRLTREHPTSEEDALRRAIDEQKGSEH